MSGERHLKRILSAAPVYEFFQWLIGVRYFRRWLRENHWGLGSGMRIVDIGCGPGDVLDSMPPDVAYWGFDVSAGYIAEARAKHGTRGTFFAGPVAGFMREFPQLAGTIDLVVCNGVMHHLTDAEAGEVLAAARTLLAPGGRFVGIEPCFLAHQSWLSRWIMNCDRGEHIRQEQAWRRLLRTSFPDGETAIATNLIRIPYTHIVMIGGSRPLSAA